MPPLAPSSGLSPQVLRLQSHQKCRPLRSATRSLVPPATRSGTDRGINRPPRTLLTPSSPSPAQCHALGKTRRKPHPRNQTTARVSYLVHQRQRNRRGGALLQRRQPRVIDARQGKVAGQEVQARARRHDHGIVGTGTEVAGRLKDLCGGGSSRVRAAQRGCRCRQARAR